MHVVKILSVEDVTHNVRRFVIEKPLGFTFIPGQATDVSINKAELRDELRPFTFTSLNEWGYLEFTIKIYKGHHGITEQLAKLKTGDELIIHEVFGTIHYKGSGVFIAGGAGITPFIAILRQLRHDGLLEGNTLLFANYNESDIILKTELKYILGDKDINVLKDPLDKALTGKTIDRELLKAYIGKKGTYYYVCGPDAFTAAMVGFLEELGVEKRYVVIEE
ncbi:MAG: FAD-binding oxidoreductase [Candidatus Pedobacter colombiensis]|uniref:FAD-binding oxidoreductase n=1 Tax=Candidatus Pedobacter colombiensis TaxID=3121371 RepID=A0AAJ5W7H2_9SPHI|nr:FAD-binding oxidoreductase [Pedobacter sp.]WEK18374.1 MAG: FAD-binding oxidoreductase [Pedobacter sp.]